VDASNKILELGTDPAEALTEGLMRPPFAIK
jgi:aspartate 1-decarboxylase